MKLQDKENSTIALHYIYCMHKMSSIDRGDVTYFRMKVYSRNNDEHYFEYTDEDVMTADMDFIDNWITFKEMGVSPTEWDQGVSPTE